MLELFGLAIVGAVALMAATLTADVRAKRTLAKVARTNIAEAVDGEWVKIVGTVARDAGELLVQDDSGRARIEPRDLVGFTGAKYSRVDGAYLDKQVGQRVAVFGWASWETDATGDYRGTGRKLVLRGTRRAPVVVSTEARFLGT